MNAPGARRLAIVLAAALAASLPALAQQRQTFAASNVKEFVKAIGPNRTIVLRKGDYRLSGAYDVSTEFATWNEADEGFELALQGVTGLTVRGADGVRLVTDSASAYLMGIYGGSDIVFDNVDFVREVAGDAEIGAGTLYAEGVERLTIDRASFAGGTGYPLELWECSEVVIKRSTVEDAVSGAIYAGYVQDLLVSDSDFNGNEGWPLLYLEGSDFVRFEKVGFADNGGGNLIEIYSDEGYVEEVLFEGCEFTGNSFDFFSGTEVLPATDACAFDGNSFDEDWAINSVATSMGDEYYGEEGDEGPVQYFDEASQLAFYYNPWWEVQEDPEAGRVAFFSTEEDLIVIWSPAYTVPARVDAVKQAKKVFGDALVAFSGLIKTEAGIQLALKETAAPALNEMELLVADYYGPATRSGGEKGFARARLVASGGVIYAFLALSPSEDALGPDSQAEYMLGSLEAPNG